jgi:glycosyltransferase involved in cell wall biosynthesis
VNADQRVLIIIPAWNEAGSIADVIAEVRDELPAYDILVVNDGSTDDTERVALEAGARVVSLPYNLGVGGAMRLG